jgi:hypothetical protein
VYRTGERFAKVDPELVEALRAVVGP